ncbi:MAG: glycosyltransferase family 39 protein [Burkholderiales bacterium]|nr:glycosyltransferase family 39 protein [Phycisphaerae bacterium]
MTIRHHLLIFLYGALLLLPFLDNGTVLSRHEVLAAEPAREMLEAGAPWSIQTFAGQPRTDKPPTMSWLIALSMKLFDSRSEFVCRLPAALAGIVAAHATAVIATRLLSSAAGLLAGLITLTTVWLQTQARLSEADMPLVAAVTIAMAALLQPAGTDAPHASKWQITRYSVLFYGATGFGFLLKGVAPMITIPAAIIYAVWARDAWARRVLTNPFGIIVLISLLIIWPIAAYLTHPPIIHAWYMHLFGRATGELQGKDELTLISYVVGLAFYFWTIPYLILPATPAAVIGVWKSGRRWRDSRAAMFLIAWVTPFLIVLMLSAWKHKHYAFPLMPAFSVLAAYGTMVWMDSVRTPTRARNLLIAWFIGCGVTILCVQKLILPSFDGYRGQADFARRVNELIPDGQRVTLYGLGEAHLAFYLRDIPDRTDDIQLQPPEKTRYLICRQREYYDLQRGMKVERLLDGPTDEKKSDQLERLVLVRVN